MTLAGETERQANRCCFVLKGVGDAVVADFGPFEGEISHRSLLQRSSWLACNMGSKSWYTPRGRSQMFQVKPPTRGHQPPTRRDDNTSRINGLRLGPGILPDLTNQIPTYRGAKIHNGTSLGVFYLVGKICSDIQYEIECHWSYESGLQSIIAGHIG